MSHVATTAIWERPVISVTAPDLVGFLVTSQANSVVLPTRRDRLKCPNSLSPAPPPMTMYSTSGGVDVGVAWRRGRTEEWVWLRCRYSQTPAKESQ